MKFLSIASLFAVALAVSGCGSVQTIDPSSEAGKVASGFSAPADGAAVYIYRDRKSHFGLHQLTLKINQSSYATFPACYFRMEFKPGDVELQAKHPDLFAGQEKVTLALAPGDVKVYEFKPISRLVIPGESKLIQRSIDDIKARVADQRLCNTETFVF